MAIRIVVKTSLRNNLVLYVKHGPVKVRRCSNEKRERYWCRVQYEIRNLVHRLWLSRPLGHFVSKQTCFDIETSANASVRIWSQQLEHKQVPKWGTEPGVRKGKRSLLASHKLCLKSSIMQFYSRYWDSIKQYRIFFLRM